MTSLDEAFDRVSVLDYKIPNPYVNHGPMACEALSALGLESEIDAWVRGFLDRVGNQMTRIDSKWDDAFNSKESLGDYRHLPEWLGFFERKIADDGWRSVVAEWVPQLMPGLVSALFHGTIRTAHAVRAIDATETPARRAELARALGNWATWFHPGAEPSPDRGGDVVTAAAYGARCYWEQPTIFNLHGVTGAMAVDVLVDFIPEHAGRQALAQLRAEHAALYRGLEPPAVDGIEWDKAVVDAAAESLDAHEVKLVEACRRGFDATGDSAFAAAAQRITGISRSGVTRTFSPTTTMPSLTRWAPSTTQTCASTTNPVTSESR